MVDADLYDPEEEDIAAQVRATLTRSGLGLVEAIRQSDLSQGTNFLLVVDQFEEIFRFRRSEDATDEQAAFVNLLLEGQCAKRFTTLCHYHDAVGFPGGVQSISTVGRHRQ